MSSVDQHRGYAPTNLAFVVITASDSRSLADDESGETVERLLAGAGHRRIDRLVVSDQLDSIRTAVRTAVESQSADVVVIAGGTGFAPRDVSVEAVAPLLDRTIDGFGELFRALSFQQVGAAAMLSRATAGVVGSSVVFVLPGSPKAVELAMTELILPEVAHLLGQVRR